MGVFYEKYNITTEYVMVLGNFGIIRTTLKEYTIKYLNIFWWCWIKNLLYVNWNKSCYLIYNWISKYSADETTYIDVVVKYGEIIC